MLPTDPVRPLPPSRDDARADLPHGTVAPSYVEGVMRDVWGFVLIVVSECKGPLIAGTILAVFTALQIWWP